MSCIGANGGGGGGAPWRSASAVVARPEPVSGSHVLEIEGYSRIKGLGNGRSIVSKKFPVGDHRWYIQFYPDGLSGYPDWISFYLCLDPSDVAEVSARYSFSLLDQDGNPVPSYSKASQTCTFNKSTPVHGFYFFMKQEELEESIYLTNDAFSVRCDVTLPKEIFTEHRQPSVMVPPSNIQQHLGELLSSGEGADVTFDVAGEKFAVHRYLLAALSPVFKAELLGPMKEKTATCVRVDDMEPTVFRALLQFIYTDSHPAEIEEDGGRVIMAQHLLVAADRYNVERLKLICEKMLCDRIDTTTAAYMLTLAEQHSCRVLKEVCFNFLACPGNFKVAVASDGFQHLTRSCPSLLKDLSANLLA